MKRLLQKKVVRAPRPAYPLQDRQRMVQFFTEERSKGVEAKEIATRLGVSTATLYRWQMSIPLRAAPNICIPPTQAIEILCDQSVLDRETLIAAIIALSVWIRWPTEPHYHDMASAALAVAYVNQTSNAKTLGELDVRSRQLIDSLVPIDMLWKSCTPMVFDLPIFSEYRIDGQPHTDSNVARDIVWYLLAHSAVERRERFKPSLNKAFYLLENNAFKFKWVISERTFQEFWRRRAPSAPFKLVEQDASPFNWSLDPADPFLSEHLNEIVESREATTKYLAQCRWAVEMIVELLHPKAADNIAFPSFPEQLPAVPMEVARMPQNMIDLLAEYRG